MSLTDSSARQCLPPSDIPEQGLSITEAARRSGVTASTLRYYERSGMMPSPPGRTSGGRRRYRAPELRWIRVCTRLRAGGMPTRLIRRYVELLRAGPGNEDERLGVLESHRDQLAEQMNELAENLRLMNEKIVFYRQQITDGKADALWAVPREPER